jgi:hypothetical protein
MGFTIHTLQQNELLWNEGYRAQDSNISVKVVYGPSLWILVFEKKKTFLLYFYFIFI